MWRVKPVTKCGEYKQKFMWDASKMITFRNGCCYLLFCLVFIQTCGSTSRLEEALSRFRKWFKGRKIDYKKLEDEETNRVQEICKLGEEKGFFTCFKDSGKKITSKTWGWPNSIYLSELLGFFVPGGRAAYLLYNYIVSWIDWLIKLNWIDIVNILCLLG